MNSDRLGRSITDLMSENDQNVEEKELVIEVAISEIYPNPEQPRTTFSSDSINELRDSILEHGIIQPVILKSSKKGYVLVAGERRVRAAKKAGLKTIPAIVREYNSKYLAELALLENLQRENLSPVEEAMALSKLLEVGNLTHEELGKKIGKSRSYVTNILGLLNLPSIIMKDLVEGKISMGHARVLSKIDDIDLILDLRSAVLQNDLTVRELEKLSQISKGETKNTKMIETVTKEWAIPYKKELEKILNGKVKYSITKNSVKLSYKNEEELARILHVLGSANK
jgi:ParB family chromosome partitioning protein